MLSAGMTSTHRGFTSLGAKQASLSEVPENEGAQRMPGLYRSISVQPSHCSRSNNMFGYNIHEVEKVLSRMANAIKKDLQLK